MTTFNGLINRPPVKFSGIVLENSLNANPFAPIANRMAIFVCDTLKKLFVTILSIIYLTASAGATVHSHYCMDKLVSWGLDAKSEKLCKNCGMDKSASAGCCQDSKKQVKLQGDQKAVESPLFLIMEAAALTQAISYINICRRFQFALEPLPIRTSHRTSKLRSHLLHCIFRI